MLPRKVGFTKNDGAQEQHKQIKKFKKDISHKALVYLGTQFTKTAAASTYLKNRIKVFFCHTATLNIGIKLGKFFPSVLRCV